MSSVSTGHYTVPDYIFDKAYKEAQGRLVAFSCTLNPNVALVRQVILEKFPGTKIAAEGIRRKFSRLNLENDSKISWKATALLIAYRKACQKLDRYPTQLEHLQEYKELLSILFPKERPTLHIGTIRQLRCNNKSLPKFNFQQTRAGQITDEDILKAYEQAKKESTLPALHQILSKLKKLKPQCKYKTRHLAYHLKKLKKEFDPHAKPKSFDRNEHVIKAYKQLTSRLTSRLPIFDELVIALAENKTPYSEAEVKKALNTLKQRHKDKGHFILANPNHVDLSDTPYPDKIKSQRIDLALIQVWDGLVTELERGPSSLELKHRLFFLVDYASNPHFGKALKEIEEQVKKRQPIVNTSYLTRRTMTYYSKSGKPKLSELAQALKIPEDSVSSWVKALNFQRIRNKESIFLFDDLFGTSIAVLFHALKSKSLDLKIRALGASSLPQKKINIQVLSESDAREICAKHPETGVNFIDASIRLKALAILLTALWPDQNLSKEANNKSVIAKDYALSIQYPRPNKHFPIHPLNGILAICHLCKLLGWSNMNIEYSLNEAHPMDILTLSDELTSKLFNQVFQQPVPKKT